jgi:hypothetical protein
MTDLGISATVGIASNLKTGSKSKPTQSSFLFFFFFEVALIVSQPRHIGSIPSTKRLSQMV